MGNSHGNENLLGPGKKNIAYSRCPKSVNVPRWELFKKSQRSPRNPRVQGSNNCSGTTSSDGFVGE